MRSKGPNNGRLKNYMPPRLLAFIWKLYVTGRENQSTAREYCVFLGNFSSRWISFHNHAVSQTPSGTSSNKAVFAALLQ